MTHTLRERHPLNAIGRNPLVVSLRYRCECSGNEVLNIQMVLDKDCSEKQFVETVKRLYRDLMFEVQQHIYPPELQDAKETTP